MDSPAPIGSSKLPKEIQTSFKKPGSSSKCVGTKELCFYSKELSSKDKLYKLASEIWSTNIGDTGFTFSKVRQVHNPDLIEAFIVSHKVIHQRAAQHPVIFQKKTWTFGEEKEHKGLIFDKYSELVERYSWNKELACPIIPGFHASSLQIADQACVYGLNIDDRSFYGQGITFSSNPAYLYPYLVTRRDPCLIMSWLVPGNIFPVTEDPKSENSLLGASCKLGYQAHYCRVSVDGYVLPIDELKKSNSRLCDEILIPQEAQCVPIFIFELETEEILRVSKLLKAEPEVANYREKKTKAEPETSNHKDK